MKAVTICAQLGSNGYEIASGVATELGWRLVYRDLANEAALRIGAPEIALAEIDEFGLLGLRPRRELRQAFQEQMQVLAREIAAQGQAVFLCWASHKMLRGMPDVLHVRVIASYEQRLKYLVACDRIPEECAAARLLASDQARNRRLRRFGANWQDSEAFHLVIHAGRVSVPDAVSLIVHAVQTQAKPSPVTA